MEYAQQTIVDFLSGKLDIVEVRKLYPGYHGYVEGVGWCSILGGIAGRSAVFLGIFFVAFQELAVVFREVRPDTGKVLVFLIEHRVHGMHIIVNTGSLFGKGRPEFGHIIDRFGQQPDHSGIQLLPL